MKAKRLILFLIWLMLSVAYFDRVNISVAGPTIMTALHLSKAQFGGALSAFQVGYALMQIPGGYLADRIGTRTLLISALVLWSGFTALTGSVGSLRTLIVVRVLFGFGEGIENGAQFKLIGDNFAPAERSSANALFLSALAVGPAVAAPVVTYLIRLVGWRGLFYGSALLGLVVAVVLALLLPRGAGSAARGTPHARIADADGPVPTLSLKDLLHRPSSFLLFAAYLFFNIGFWGFVYWMPTYLSETRHITLAKLGFTAAIPFVAGFFGLLVMGYLGSHALRRFRPGLTATGYVGAAASLFAAFSVSDVRSCIVALSAAAFFLYGGFGPFWAAALDRAPSSSRGTFTGFVNTGGQIGGIFAPVVVGRIFDVTRSFTGGFLFMIGALLLSACSLWVLQSDPGRAVAPDDAEKSLAGDTL